MGSVHPVPVRPAVREGITRLCVSGFTLSHHTGRARKVADEVQRQYPDKYETWFYFGSHDEYRAFLEEVKKEIPANEEIQKHSTSPFCWLETENEKVALGGRDRLCEWAHSTFADNKSITDMATDPNFFADVKVNTSPGSAQSA